MANLGLERISSEEMDEIRQENTAYEYLCHLEEAKKWIEVCINEDLPPTTELEENLRNGVYLAKIANFVNPTLVPITKIYDFDQSVYKNKGLQFRHTDNINHWFKAMESIQMPKYIYPDTFDVYDRRNMPKAIFCIHELSLNLYNSGKAPRIQDLLGKAIFTSEEINAMQMELEKSGIEMPHFSKLGKESGDSVWDTVIAINKALDDDDSDIIKYLKNPKGQFKEVIQENEMRYKYELSFSRHVKVNNTCNRDFESSVQSASGDTYQNLLDNYDIQQCIYRANESKVLEDLENALKKRNVKAVLKCLKHPHLKLSEVIPNNVTFYLENLVGEGELNAENIQTIIEIANEEAKEKQAYVERVNNAISKNDTAAMLNAIQALIKEPIANLDDPLLAAFYFQEFSAIRNYSNSNLSYGEIVGGVTVLQSIWNITLSIQKRDQDLLLRALKNPDAHLSNVSQNLANVYLEKFATYLELKEKQKQNPFFSHSEIQEILDELWQEFDHQNKRDSALTEINNAIFKGDLELLAKSLLNPAASILCIHKNNIQLYLWGLKQKQENKQAHLNLDEIRSKIKTANKKAEQASKICSLLSTINMVVDRNSPKQLLEELKNPLLEISETSETLVNEYMKALQKFRTIKSNNYATADKENGSWIYCYLDNGHKFYQNLHTLETTWQQPQHFTHSIYLTQLDIKQIIEKVNLNNQDKMITLLQAYSKGYLCRKTLAEREYHLEKMEDEAVVIQRWWRRCLFMKKEKAYVDLVRRVGGIRAAVIKIQSCVRMFRARKLYKERRAALDVSMERNQALQELMKKDPLHYVSIYLSLLKVNDIDYEEEMELHKIRSQVVKKIRSNKELENQVNEMDLKIALLIKNQLSARELMLHGNKLSKVESNRRQTMDVADCKALINLQSFNKESRFLLEGYQNLFYTLQTDPRYLARLIYSMAPGRSAKFIDSVIYTLYNYGSTPREECLLLQLFKQALEEEVKMKVDAVEDICKGTPLVYKMIVDFNKTGCGHSCLRELLEPLVENILEDEKLHLSTDPVEVYKRWVNEQETTTGVMSQLPYDLPPEEAEKLPEVAARIANSVAMLQEKTEMFINRILHSVELLPYGIRYTSKVLFNLLKLKFPHEEEKKVMKSVGNLLYYRYMIAAIPAADTFGVVTLQPGNSINSVQRKNLGAIAKVLQHAAAFQLFEPNTKLALLNGYLEKCHNKCLKFLKVACDVDEPENIFCMDTYSEATLLAAPQVSLSLQEIVSTHQLLCNYIHNVAPDKNDKIHVLLEDLGTPVTLETNAEKDSSNTICLSLTNKFFETKESSAMDQLFLTTKQLVIQLLQCQSIGSTFVDMLRTAPSKDDEDHFTEHKASIQCNSVKELLHRYTNVNELRHQIMRNLRKLEENNYVTKQSDYREVIDAIVKMIANRRMYRERRKDEIYKLQMTQEQLTNKTKYFQDTLAYYNQYIQNCLERMAPKNSKKSTRISILGRDDPNMLEKAIVVKYTATKLHEKGVLLEIVGLETSQLKHVTFTFTSSKKTGVYLVKATFMGAAVETVELDIQLLLQQQYEGATVLEIFGKAKININLLLHLLNKKFVN